MGGVGVGVGVGESGRGGVLEWAVGSWSPARRTVRMATPTQHRDGDKVELVAAGCEAGLAWEPIVLPRTTTRSSTKVTSRRRDRAYLRRENVALDDLEPGERTECPLLPR
jgi:hypothetical protein